MRCVNYCKNFPNLNTFAATLQTVGHYWEPNKTLDWIALLLNQEF